MNKTWWTELLASDRAPIWFVGLAIAALVTLIAGFELRALFTAGALRPGADGMGGWVYEYQTLIAGGFAVVATLLAATVTVREIRRQISAARRDTESEIQESRRQFAFQMRVTTARERAELDRVITPMLNVLTFVLLSVEKRSDYLRQKQVHAARNRTFFLVKRFCAAGERFDSDQLRVLKQYLDARQTVVIAHFVTDAARYSGADRTAIDEFVGDDEIETIREITEEAAQVLRAVQEEARGWGEGAPPEKQG